jgi:hypothetical protein
MVTVCINSSGITVCDCYYNHILAQYCAYEHNISTDQMYIQNK